MGLMDILQSFNQRGREREDTANMDAAMQKQGMSLGDIQRSKLIEGYAKQYPFLANALSDPNLLQQFLIQRAQSAVGGQYNQYETGAAKRALSDIYGIR